MPRLLHGTSATNDGADDRTLLLTELVPAKIPPPPQEPESSPIACHNRVNRLPRPR